MQNLPEQIFRVEVPEANKLAAMATFTGANKEYTGFKSRAAVMLNHLPGVATMRETHETRKDLALRVWVSADSIDHFRSRIKEWDLSATPIDAGTETGESAGRKS